MKTIKIRIRGTGEGILMHSAQSMLDQGIATKNPAKNYDPKEEAEKGAYRNKKKELIIPARCMKACFLGAASWYKFGKNSAKQIIAGCTTIDPREIKLVDYKGKVLKKYEIDLRTVNIQKAKIVRARPLIEEWEADFNLIYDDELIDEKGIKVLETIFKEAGKRMGLLDNRPQKFGENGKFKVVIWKVAKK